MVEDIVNSGFHLGAAIFTFLNCYTLYKEKEVKGVNVFTTVFMVLWGLWNLYYFKALNQPFTWYMNIAILSANVLWVSLVFKYRKVSKV